jgi:hypothetical protein
LIRVGQCDAFDFYRSFALFKSGMVFFRFDIVPAYSCMTLFAINLGAIAKTSSEHFSLVFSIIDVGNGSKQIGVTSLNSKIVSKHKSSFKCYIGTALFTLICPFIGSAKMV